MARIIDLTTAVATHRSASPGAEKHGSDLYDPLADLLRASARGERDAFARLYDLTSAKLLALTTKILRRRDLGEEALHDAYLRIWRSAHRYEPAKGKAQAWITTIARNVALTMVIRYQRELPNSPLIASAEPTSTLPDPFDQALIAEETRQLASCMQRLPDPQMQAIVLAYLEGLTHRELADRMEIPLGTAKSSVRRGLQGLRRCMEGQASSDDLAPLLAGEYSLGVLRGQARDRFMRKRSQQAHICHLADEWDYRLAALIDLLPETPPAPEVWHEIEKALPSYTSKRTDKHVWRPVALGLLALCVVLIALLAIP